MTISILVAIAENGVIGRAGTLPWRLPADLRRFRRLTTGHAIIMGRRTYESIGRPLPQRTSIVVTGNPGYRVPGVLVAHSLDEALAQVSGEEVFVIGGAQLFRLALPRADRLYLTLLHVPFEGDVYFPPIDWAQWNLVEDTRHEPDPANAYPYSFRVYHRAREAVENR